MGGLVACRGPVRPSGLAAGGLVGWRAFAIYNTPNERTVRHPTRKDSAPVRKTGAEQAAIFSSILHLLHEEAPSYAEHTGREESDVAELQLEGDELVLHLPRGGPVPGRGEIPG